MKTLETQDYYLRCSMNDPLYPNLMYPQKNVYESIDETINKFQNENKLDLERENKEYQVRTFFIGKNYIDVDRPKGDQVQVRVWGKVSSQSFTINIDDLHATL